VKSSNTFTLAVLLALATVSHASAQSTDVLTYHNDNARTGQQLHEEILTPANVNAAHFGKLWVLNVDGKVDAQPLYAAGVPIQPIPGKGLRNILFVATEHDSVYAFDADSTNVFWRVSLLGVGETPSDSRNCFQVMPEIGVTATPVINRQLGTNGTLFVVAMSKRGTSYFQRLHALDLATGIERIAPVTITATYPGTGDGSSGGQVIFNPAQYEERPGLLLLNGVVYTAWSSHCDSRPYTGWLIGYDAQTLTQVSVLNIIPNGNSGSIWMSAAGLAADDLGNFYCISGNGTLDTTLTPAGFPINGDFGNSVVKLGITNSGLAVLDYFAPSNTVSENAIDQDLGSGGALVLPEMLDAQNQPRHLVVGAGKDSRIYLLDTADMGKFHTSTNAIYQQVNGAITGGVWGMAAYFNGTLYYGAVGDRIKAFPFENARLGSRSSQTSSTFVYPGATPSISANSTTNGILWAARNTTPAGLHAYAATNLAVELFNTDQSGTRDQFGTGNKFITPTIASGRVYVGTTTGVGVFGLLDQSSLTPLQAWRNDHFGNPSNVGAGANGASPAGDGIPNLLKYAVGLDPLTATTSSAFLSGGLEAFGGQKYLTLTVTRSAEVPDINYVVEVSSDLVTWSSGVSSTVTLTDTPTQLVVRDNTPAQSIPKRFLRLRVSTR
jgi:hypothetical protein